jgi:hypothetical protein
MVDSQNPNQDRDRNRHTHNPPPTNPDTTRRRERPMDDPGRGHGDKLERQLPGQSQDSAEKPDQ